MRVAWQLLALERFVATANRAILRLRLASVLAAPVDQWGLRGYKFPRQTPAATCNTKDSHALPSTRITRGGCINRRSVG